MTTPYDTTRTDVGKEDSPTISIIQGDVPADFQDNLGKFTTPTTSLDLPTDYHIRSWYEKDGHKYMAGITSPTAFQGNSCAVFQLTAPTLLWVMEWTACQYNSQPSIPDPTPGVGPGVGQTWEVLDVQCHTEMVEMGANAVTPLYRVSGVYVYACYNPSPEVWADVQFGRPPYMNADGISRVMLAANLKQDLGNVNSTGSTGGSNTL